MRDGDSTGRLGPVLSVIVPTYNESGNVAELVRRLEVALSGLQWEVVFVDDNSPDGTWSLAKEIAARDGRVRCVRRVGRRGLAGACIEGMLSSAAPFVAVMDGDLQHDEAILPQLYQAVASGAADVAIGSRHVGDGNAASGFSKERAALSDLGKKLVATVIRTEVHDPMSGFFLLRRDLVEKLAADLSPVGFKILADILATSPEPLRVKEVAYRFRQRHAGESKLDTRVGLDFLGLLVHRATAGYVPTRFVLFAIAGAIGVAVHFAVLSVMLGVAAFNWAHGTATVLAMTSNFFVNNAMTYRDARLKGMQMVKGLALFYMVCGLGIAANVGVAVWFYERQPVWWLAALVGVMMGAVWNYALSSQFVWRSDR